VCANRFYVQDAVYDEFVTKFVAAVAELKMGNGLEAGVNIGPLIDIKAKNSVLGYINTAIEQGASIALGGKSAGGLFVEPTVLTNVTQEMDIVQTELFGPVAPIVRFSHDEELVSCANDTIYGLASYFYTNNIHRAFHIAEKLEYGMVGINEGLISNEVAPFGGVKQSGFGREGAKQGIDEYLNIKYLCFGGF
jgi:succinate-semialdehyde dehydrogenase/glutarate-semialdehyde dehydrogenase